MKSVLFKRGIDLFIIGQYSTLHFKSMTKRMNSNTSGPQVEADSFLVVVFT